MITLRLSGGLGNQMFEYATARALALYNQTELILDKGDFKYDNLRDFELDKYNINVQIVEKNYFLKKLCRKISCDKYLQTYYIEKTLLYDKNLFALERKHLYLDGYFQSENYFKFIRKVLLEDFTIKTSLSTYTLTLIQRIQQERVSVSLHIRRGDYVTNSVTQTIHGSCSLEYYHKGMAYLNERYLAAKYFVFSDDIAWVQDNLAIDNAVYIINDEKRIPHEDIYLMSLCTHNIIANSSFSWWGAWLNKNEQKEVIAPKRWFVDEILQQQTTTLVPQEWVRI